MATLTGGPGLGEEEDEFGGFTTPGIGPFAGKNVRRVPPGQEAAAYAAGKAFSEQPIPYGGDGGVTGGGVAPGVGGDGGAGGGLRAPGEMYQPGTIPPGSSGTEGDYPFDYIWGDTGYRTVRTPGTPYSHWVDQMGAMWTRGTDPYGNIIDLSEYNAGMGLPAPSEAELASFQPQGQPRYGSRTVQQNPRGLPAYQAEFNRLSPRDPNTGEPIKSGPYSTTPPAPPGPSRSELLEAARGRGQKAAEGYFTSQGAPIDVGPGYGDEIIDRMASIMAGIPETATDFDQPFAGAGEGLYGELQGARRKRLGEEFESMFAPGYEEKYLPFTSDDPYIEQILTEDRAQPIDWLKNLRMRGVITETGEKAALEDLERQTGLGRTRLGEIGTQAIRERQGRFAEPLSAGRTKIGQLGLATPFDPASYEGEIESLASSLLPDLPGRLRGGLGSIPLYDTAGLLNLAGAGQGAQNTPFDPDLFAGVPPAEEEEEEDEFIPF